MVTALPLGSARLKRPESVFRYTFEHFVAGLMRRGAKLPDPRQLSVIPIEAVAPGDVQVLAAHELLNPRGPVIDLDVLADFPSVESVIVSTPVRTSRELPGIRELLFDWAWSHETVTLRNLTGLEALYALLHVRLDLESLPAAQMRKLAISRWYTKSLAPLEQMTGLTHFRANLSRDPLDPVAKMGNLKFLHISGPAKGWAKLRECSLLEEAYFYDVQIANLRRWNTWHKLRVMGLSGRGVKSLAGLESLEQLEQLTLINLAMHDLSPLRELPRLATLSLHMVSKEVDLDSVAAIPGLRSFVIDSTAGSEVLHLPELRPLAKSLRLEELVLLEVAIDNGDLTPLADLPRLRRVQLDSRIGANVEALRAARPDIEIDYTPPDLKFEALREQVGALTIQKPGEGLEQWSIFQSMASELGVATNYAAEGRLKREVKARDAALAKRLEWDTEAGAVGVYANQEADIRAVAEIVNDLLKRAGRS